MENHNLIELEIQENDWIFNKAAKKLKLKFSGEEDLFLKNKDIHKFFNRIIKIKQYGIIIIYFGKNIVIVDDNMIVNLLEQDRFDEKLCTTFKFEDEILQVFASDNEKYISVLTESSLLIFNTQSFIESKEERIKENINVNISVNEKQNINNEMKIVDLFSNPYLFWLNNQTNSLSIYSLNNQAVLIKELKGVLMFDVFERKNLVVITEGNKMKTYQIENKNNSVDFLEKNNVNLTQTLNFDISARGYIFCHLQILNAKFFSIITQYYENDDQGNLEYYTTTIYFLEHDNLNIKNIYFSDELFNYNSKNDFKDFPKYQILPIKTNETELYVISNSHYHKTVMFHYDDLEEKIVINYLNDDKIIATVFDKDLDYMSLFCGMIFYEFQLRKYINNTKINVDSEEFKRPPLIFCVTNLGDLIIYYFINRRETDPQLTKEYKNANINSGLFKKTINKGVEKKIEKNENSSKSNTSIRTLNFNDFLNVNNKTKISNNPQQPQSNKQSFNIDNNLLGNNSPENQLNFNKKIEQNDIFIQKNLPQIEINKKNDTDKGLFNIRINNEENTKNDFQLKKKEEDELKKKLQEKKRNEEEEIRKIKEESNEIKDGEEQTKVKKDIEKGVDNLMKFLFEKSILPIFYKLEDKMNNLYDVSKFNFSLDEVKDKLVGLCNELKEISENLIKQEDFDNLNKNVSRTIKNFKESEIIFKELQSKNLTEKEINDYIESIPEYRQLDAINKKFNLKYKKFKEMIDSYHILIQEMIQHIFDLSFPHLEEQIRISKKYEGHYSKFKKSEPVSIKKISESVLDKFIKTCEVLKKKQDEVRKKIDKIYNDNMTGYRGFRIDFSEDIEKIFKNSSKDQIIYDPFSNQPQYNKINNKITKLINSCQGSYTILNDFNADSNFDEFYNKRKKDKIAQNSKVNIITYIDTEKIDKILEKTKIIKNKEIVLNQTFERNIKENVKKDINKNIILPPLTEEIKKFYREFMNLMFNEKIPDSNQVTNNSYIIKDDDSNKKTFKLGFNSLNNNLEETKPISSDKSKDMNLFGKKEDKDQEQFKSIIQKNKETIEKITSKKDDNQPRTNLFENQSNSNNNKFSAIKDDKNSIPFDNSLPKKEQTSLFGNNNIFGGSSLFKNNNFSQNKEEAKKEDKNPIFGNILTEKKEEKKENKNPIFANQIPDKKEEKKETKNSLFTNIIPEKKEENKEANSLLHQKKKENVKNEEKNKPDGLFNNNKTETNKENKTSSFQVSTQNLSNLKKSEDIKKDTDKNNTNNFNFAGLCLDNNTNKGNPTINTNSTSNVFNTPAKENELIKSETNKFSFGKNDEKSNLFGFNKNITSNEANKGFSFTNTNPTSTTSNMPNNVNNVNNAVTQQNPHSSHVTFGAKSSLINNFGANPYSSVKSDFVNFGNAQTSSNAFNNNGNNNPNTLTQQQQTNQNVVGFQNYTNKSTGLSGFNQATTNSGGFFKNNSQNSGFVNNQSQGFPNSQNTAGFFNNQQSQMQANQNQNNKKTGFFLENKDNEDFFN